MNEVFEVSRPGNYVPKVVFVDGLWGCGKTMLSPIVASFERVELLSYLYELEYIVSLDYLGRISKDASETMIKMLVDLKLYHQMMGRDVNFRPEDLSSVYQDIQPLKYIRRLSLDGDEATPEKIREEQPILHLATHNVLAFSDPIISALGERALFVEVVRHPLYMAKQIYLNFERLIGDPRDFTIYFKANDKLYPYYVRDWVEDFDRANRMEKAILYMQKLSELSESHYENEKNVLVIPFEAFVLTPDSHLKKLESFMKTEMNDWTQQMLIRQKVPRAKTVSGIDLDIYRRCGWQPSKEELSERQELDLRYEYVIKEISSEHRQILDQLVTKYETQFWRPEQ